MQQPLEIELELTIDEWVGTNMRAWPTLFQNRMGAVLSLFTTYGAGYYWHNGRIGDCLITQRSVDALEEFRKGGHISDRPSDTDYPPSISDRYSLLAKIPDDVAPDALAAAWEVLEYLDCDPGAEPVESPPRALTEDEIACNAITHECLVEMFSQEWGLSVSDTEAKMEENRLRNEEEECDTPSPQMRDWMMRKSNQELARRIKSELVERGLTAQVEDSALRQYNLI